MLLGLPDFRNASVWLRVGLLVNQAALLITFAGNTNWRQFPSEFLQISIMLEPVTLVSLLILTSTSEWLRELRKPIAAIVVFLLVLFSTVAVRSLYSALQSSGMIAVGIDRLPSVLRSAAWALLASAGMLAWFDLLRRAQSPALAEARLMALTSRIRPHFLFNALNAVLGVIRSDPRRAETALEELSDLFRVLMQENTTLVPLSKEIAVARQYLNLERLRLGDRICVRWEMTECPPDPLVPPLMLQPLLENAIYYGVEPATHPGEVCVCFKRVGNRIRLELSNPFIERHGQGGHGKGNQMALANIRERLMLFFDLEATLSTRVDQGRFNVAIEFPFRQGDYLS